ncbi:MAG: BON domain-containing protein [Candidatus Acidiferrales bacterium]
MRRTTKVLLSAMAILALVAGCSKVPNDAALGEQIKAQMFSDAALKDSNLQVTVSKGEVTLAGTVPSDAARLEAYKLATQTPGVAKVNDQMSVQTAQATPAAAPAPEPAPEPAPASTHKARTHKHAPAATPDTQEVASAATPEPAPAPAPAPEPAPVAAPAAPAPPPPPQPKQVDVPAGTTMTIRMIDGVDSSVNHAGEVFHASLEAPLVVNNEVIVPRGADVFVRLVNASSAGHLTGKSDLKMELVKMDFQGRSYPLVSSTYDVSGTSRGKRTTATVGGAAAIGALIGAIAGGGKGAAIGAGVGAGSGGVYQAATKGKQVKIPSETKLDFQLEAPVTITYMPHATSSAN